MGPKLPPPTSGNSPKNKTILLTIHCLWLGDRSAVCARWGGGGGGGSSDLWTEAIVSGKKITQILVDLQGRFKEGFLVKKLPKVSRSAAEELWRVVYIFVAALLGEVALLILYQGLLDARLGVVFDEERLCHVLPKTAALKGVLLGQGRDELWHDRACLRLEQDCGALRVRASGAAGRYLLRL